MISSVYWHRRNIGTMDIWVNRLSSIASGTLTTQAKQLSNRKVISACPPERRVK